MKLDQIINAWELFGKPIIVADIRHERPSLFSL